MQPTNRTTTIRFYRAFAQRRAMCYQRLPIIIQYDFCIRRTNMDEEKNMNYNLLPSSEVGTKRVSRVSERSHRTEKSS